MTQDGSTQLLPSCRLDQLNDKATQKTFEKTGCLLISDFLPLDLLAALKTQAEASFETSTQSGNFVKVGHKRRMITLPIKDGFADERLYAPAPLTSFCDATLGQDHIINCFTCVISKPGATQQHTHTDFSGLFGTPLDMFAPSYAINLFIPLVPLNDINGTTQMWPGTHKKPLASPEEHDGILPNVPLGSAVLMDYRVQHRGTANLSDEMRPILTIAYSRRWFIDTSNFATVAPLDLSQEQFETMDDRRIALFERAKLYF